MKHIKQKPAKSRNRLVAEMFATDQPFHHRVERDMKNDYRRHMKHEKVWLASRMVD